MDMNLLTANYIPIIPRGQDLTGLKPQEKLSKDIAKHILGVDGADEGAAEMPRVIGIEGKWGSGKSNVIQMLMADETIKENYEVFEFDTWAYQEDNYRISLMEYITNDLISKDNTKADWGDLLKNALSKVEEKKERFSPNMSNLLQWFIGILAFTSLFSLILSSCPDNTVYRMWRCATVASPWLLFVGIVLWYRKDIEELTVLFEKVLRNGTTTTSIYAREPSVTDLRSWLRKVGEKLDRKLIIVFDNMDRLPKEKVKELWSAIHVFTNSKDLKDVWTIIPYDTQKLKDVYGDEYKKYISKVIPILYNVGVPILTDKRDVFDELYEKAFGANEATLTVVRGMFMMTYKGFSIRDVIHFINRMVTVRRQHEKISMVSVAIFVLMEEEIIAAPQKTLLSDNFTNKYAHIVKVDDDVKNEVAAIAYNVDVNNAKQVLYIDYLFNATVNDVGLPLDELTKRSDFYKVLTDYYTPIDADLFQSYIEVLNVLEPKTPKEFKNEMDNCWQSIISYYNGCDYNVIPWSDTEIIKPLLIRCNAQQKEEMLERFFASLVRRNYKGEELFIYPEELSDLMEANDISASKVMGDDIIEPNRFHSYLNAAKDEYRKYPVKCKADEWESYCVMKIAGHAEEMLVLKYLKDDSDYTFAEVKKKAEEMLTIDGASHKNLWNVFKIYKSLSDKPIDKVPQRFLATSETLNNSGNYTSDPDFIALRMFHDNKPLLSKDIIPQVSESILHLMHPVQIFRECYTKMVPCFVDVTKYIVENKLFCDRQIQQNALEFCMPLVKKGVVSLDALSLYFNAHQEYAKKIGAKPGIQFG